MSVEVERNAAWAPSRPRISVLVPFFRDDPSGLVAALDTQEGVTGEVEVVVLDDGSGDPDLARRVAAAVAAARLPATFVRLPDNRGRSGARNELVRHARGTHVLFLDGDMLPDHPSFLRRYLDLVAADDPAVAFGGFSVEHAPGDRAVAVHRRMTSRSDCVPATVRAAEPAKYVFTSNLLVRREVLEAEPFDEGHQGWGWEDVEWGLRVSARWGIVHLDNTATHLGLEPVEALVRKYRQSVPNFARVVERHRALVEGYPSYRVARVLARIPGSGLLPRVLPAVAAAPFLPVGLRAFALRLFRAALYARVVPSTGPSPQRRLRWAVTEPVVAVWDRRVRPVPVPPGAPPLLAVSCHLDDAVLSCGGALAAFPGSVVVTVMTAHVPALAGATAWDRSCGFRPGADVMAVRRQEDERALRLLGARPRHLGAVEAQYGPAFDVDAAVEQVLGLIDDLGPARVLVPLGIDNPEHRALADGLVEALRARPDVDWLLYDDLPYREQFPAVHRARLAELRDRGLPLEPVALPAGSRRRKLAAMRAYRTQCRALAGDLRSCLADEGYWTPTP